MSPETLLTFLRTQFPDREVTLYQCRSATERVHRHAVHPPLPPWEVLPQLTMTICDAPWESWRLPDGARCLVAACEHGVWVDTSSRQEG